MHVFRFPKTSGDPHTVGYLDAEGTWQPVKDCRSEDEAMAWTSYLNGGEHPDMAKQRFMNSIRESDRAAGNRGIVVDG